MMMMMIQMMRMTMIITVDLWCGSTESILPTKWVKMDGGGLGGPTEQRQRHTQAVVSKTTESTAKKKKRPGLNHGGKVS